MAIFNDEVVKIEKRVLPNEIATNIIGVPPMAAPLTLIDLNALAAEVHVANEKWWYDLDTGARLDRNKDELMMLFVTEAAEACEGERKSSPEKLMMDDKLPHRPMAEVEIADILIRTLDFAGAFGYNLGFDAEPAVMTDNRAQSLLRIVKKIVYLSDVVEQYPDDHANISYLTSAIITSCFAYSRKFGYDLMGAYHEKMAFNKVRKDHQIEARKAAGGKKF